jgi:L-ascorbate metabolism protein UlaG (beta-lactamase superfamily)
MRRWALAFLLMLTVSLAGGSPGWTGEKAAPPITITYHGQSFYIVTTSKGKRIAFDPHQIPQYYDVRSRDQMKADIILISHNHNDHNRVAAIDNFQKAKVIRGLKSENIRADWNHVDETIDGIKIQSVGVYHDNSEGLERYKNAVFIVEVDGWRIVHLGDLGHLLTPSQVKRIGHVDVLMIPVGGIYTINGSEARKVVEQLNPKEYIFPMHYGTKEFDYALTPDEFYEGQPKRNIAISDDNVLKLNRDQQRPRPLTVQLHYWPKDKK